MNTNSPIGIFDSGIGGVTVLKEILKILPNENYIYYSDSKNNPYGDKSDEQILNFCDEIVKQFINKNCKAIVIACNTASAKSAKFLREKYQDKIIIAIEPAYKMVHDYAYNGATLIMATKGTLESEKFYNLYEKYNNNKTYLLPCKGLAELIENGYKEDIDKYLEKNLSKYKGNVENIVLGCTHYPLIKNQIKEVLGNVNFFEGSPSLALHLKQVLESKELVNLSENIGNIEFIDSNNSELKKERFLRQLGQS